MSDWIDAEGHAERAFEMFERGRWAEAEMELRKALSLNPSQAEWHFNLGLTLEASGRDPEALDSYERAIELLPTEVDPLVAAGIVANRQNRCEDAIRWFDRALTLEFGCEPAYAHKMQSHLRLGDHEEVEATYYLSQQALDEPSPHCLAVMAESLMERGKAEHAGWCLREAIRLDPTMPRLRARLGSVFAATGQQHRALQMFLRDLRDDPGNIDTLLDYGELLIDLRRLPEASEKFRRVLEMEPANIDAHVMLGQIAMQSGQFEQAYVEFELVARLDPEYLQNRVNLANVLLRRGMLDDARECLCDLHEMVRGAEQPSTSAVDTAQFGSLLLDADMACEAVEVLQQIADDDESSVDILRKLALARYQSGDRRGGAACSRKVLRLNPGCVQSMHNLALAALQANRLFVARAWIQRGLKVDKHDDGLRRLRTRLWMAMLRRALGMRKPIAVADKASALPASS